MTNDEEFDGVTLCLGPVDEFCRAVYALQCEMQPRVAVRLIRGKNTGSTDALFREFAAALQFPCYFGNNWNAFDECMADLEWLAGEGYIILIADGGKILDLEKQEREVFFRIMASAANEWAAVRGISFRTFLQCRPDEVEPIQRSLATPAAVISVGELRTAVSRHGSLPR